MSSLAASLSSWMTSPVRSVRRSLTLILAEPTKAVRGIEMPNNYVLHLDVVKILWRFVGSDMYAPTVYVSDDSVVL